MTTRTLARIIDGQFVVILRNDNEAFIGTATVEGETLTIRRGFTGRPAVFPLTDVEAYTVVSNGTREVDLANLTPTGFAFA
jgi:hypothetical protein